MTKTRTPMSSAVFLQSILITSRIAPRVLWLNSPASLMSALGHYQTPSISRKQPFERLESDAYRTARLSEIATTPRNPSPFVRPRTTSLSAFAPRVRGPRQRPCHQIFDTSTRAILRAWFLPRSESQRVVVIADPRTRSHLLYCVCSRIHPRAQGDGGAGRAIRGCRDSSRHRLHSA